MSITMGQLATRFAKASSQVNSVAPQEIRKFAQVGVGLVKREIQAVHAVDTGTMLNSTDAERSGQFTYLIGPTVNYAPFVALGTSRVSARPFHIRAAKKLASQIREFGVSADRLGL